MSYSKNNAKKAPEPKKAPVHKVYVSGVVAAIWENKGDDDKLRHNVTFERSYRTEDGYGQTGSYGARDLQNLRKAADLAHSWIIEQRQQPQEDGE
jgi:hypothetical protein